MRNLLLPIAAICGVLAFVVICGGTARAASFGGYECTEDCSGHAAGYDWAEHRDVTDADECPLGNSESFHEGCLARTEDPMRRSDEDDEGNAIDK